ncbi:MAG TPA: hypothetical protein VFF06_11150 [Polyangia bacterium]|nr:hypothetical protein [Polyangia bacterium]
MTTPRVVLALALLLGGAARGEPLVFLPPVGDNPEASALGDLMHARAERILIESGAPAVTNLRHVLAAAELIHAPPSSWLAGPAPQQIAALLGARSVVTARLRQNAAGYTLELQRVEGGKAGAASTVPLAPPLASIINEGARALAAAALGSPPRAELRFPATLPPRALTDYASCLAAVARQPIVLDSPQVVRTAELDRALASCREAIVLAPELDGAKATLGLALAIFDQAPEAAAALANVPTASYDPSLLLAHYWLATRYRSADAGLEVLREAARRFPGSLLARVMLAEHLYVTRQNDAALAAWRDVQALAADSPLTQSRVSALYARLGKYEQAIAMAKAAAQPGDAGGAITLASRYLDAGRNPEAIAVLEPIAVDGAPPKAFERLGRAYLRVGQLAKAERAFERAREDSDRSLAEWRVRGHAFAGLVLVAAARRNDGAVDEVARQARDEGFAPFLRALNDATITAALERLDAGDRGKTGPRTARVQGPKYVRPTEATPFALDPAGEIDPRGHGYKQPPSFIQVLRF